jgi:TolB-like protein
LLFRFGDFTLDAERLELKRSGEVQKLEPQFFSLLVDLVENRDRVISKDELIDGVWGGRIVSDATLNTCVNGLRRLLGDSGRSQSVVRTFPRRGFRFVAQNRIDQDLSKAEQLKPMLADLTEDRPSIAVLPFKFLSSEPDQEFIAEGLVEDIITLLSTVPELFVIARNTTFTYKDQTPDAGTVAKELDVRYVLEGSVRKAGNRIRVSAQFIDALTGSHLWADRYDRDIDDIFELQDEVSQGIVGALQSRLLIAESAHLSRMPADRVDAWGNVVKARVRMFAYRPEDIDEAEPFACRALEIQPGYAPAFAILA